MDPIPRAAFLKLVNRSKASFNIHRSRGEMMLGANLLQGIPATGK